MEFHVIRALQVYGRGCIGGCERRHCKFQNGLSTERSLQRKVKQIEKSLKVLMNANAVDDAAIVLKSIFEIEFQLGAIKNDRQIAVDFILQAESARLKRLKRFRDSGRPLPEGMTVEEINRQLQEDRGEIKELSKEFLAEHAKMGNEYAIFYSALSDVADSSPVGLRHYIEEGTSIALFDRPRPNARCVRKLFPPVSGETGFGQRPGYKRIRAAY